MLDDDIQYIGSRPAPRVVPDNPFPAIQQTVTGVVLHIEKSGTQPAYDMVLRRATTSVVHIGRRPGSAAELRQDDTSNAMFRCAVVSRKHAKIAFTDSGHAYLIDLNSHHGTHIRKPGEMISEMLKPEIPAILVDGDIITFGKSVGRNNEYVRPVVAKVQLLYSSQPDPPFKPFIVTDSTSTSSSHLSSAKSNSGRYGVYMPSSSSSDDISSNESDYGSDVGEPPVSGANALPLQSRGGHSANFESGSHLGRAFEVLKRLIPPVHGADPATREESSNPTTFSSFHPQSPCEYIPDSRDYPGSPIYSPHSPSPISFSPRSQSPLLSMPPHVHPITQVEPYSIGFDVVNHGDQQEHAGRQSDERSRSTSSMDLASPSPPLSARASTRALVEPSVIGAWPTSRSSSPNISSDSSVPAADSAVAAAAPPPSSNASDNADSGCMSESSAQTQAGNITIACTPPPASASPIPEVSDQYSIEVSGLKAGLARLQGEVTKLQAHRRKYKSRFNANVHTISDKLTDLDDRVTDVNAQYTMLVDQVENVTHYDMPDLQAQVEALENQAKKLPTMPATTSEPLLHEREDVKASIQTLRELVDEMRTLRESTQKHMAAELEAVRAARDAALVTIAAHAQTPVLASLKRKRSDDKDEDEDEDGGGVGEELLPRDHRIGVDVGVGVDEAAAIVAIQEAIVPTATTTVTSASGIAVPSPKRARRIATVVVQTATAVTVGAVATWSALAFS